MAERSISLDETTFRRLAELSEQEGRPVADLIRDWTESALLAAQIVERLNEKDAARAALKARERAARTQVSGFSARDNLARDQLYRG
jgi:predicted DNA-binding protein